MPTFILDNNSLKVYRKVLDFSEARVRYKLPGNGFRMQSNAWKVFKIRRLHLKSTELSHTCFRAFFSCNRITPEVRIVNSILRVITARGARRVELSIELFFINQFLFRIPNFPNFGFSDGRPCFFWKMRFWNLQFILTCY